VLSSAKIAGILCPTKVTELSTNPIISIIDDDESSRIAAESLVASFGFIAHAFPSAEAFLASGDLARTACLITDIQLPGMSGLDLQERLREGGHWLPIIFMTAFPEPKRQRRAEAGGAWAYFEKPFDGGQLVKRIAEALDPEKGV
jgi:FixJ family two-component response regulator